MKLNQLLARYIQRKKTVPTVDVGLSAGSHQADWQG